MRENNFAVPEQRRSKLALVPLWMIVVAFVLPTYQACSTVDSPLSVAAGGVAATAWVLPPYLFALVFAMLTVAALSQRKVSLVMRQRALGALVAFAIASLIGAATFSFERTTPDLRWICWAAGSCVAAVALVRSARGRAPWLIWERLIGAFAVLAVGNGPSLLLGADLLSGNTGPLRAGAYVYLGSLAVLLLLTAVGYFAANARER